MATITDQASHDASTATAPTPRPPLPGPGLPPLVQAVAFHRDPLGVLRRCRSRYGDVFTLRLGTAGPFVVVADVDAIDDLAGSDPARSHAGEARRRILPQASPRSSFGADGEQHRRSRGRIEGVLGPESIASRRPAIARIAVRHADGWPIGRPFRLLPRVRAAVDEVFVRVILGVRDDRRAKALVGAIGRMLWTPGNPPISPPGGGMGAVDEAARALFDRRKAPVERLLAEEIAHRATYGSGAEDDDLIAAMLAGGDLDPPAIVDELLPVLMAGQEPPAIALTNLIDRLGRTPDLKRLFSDPSDERTAAQDEVVRETLRLRPSASAMLRRLTAPVAVAGRVLAAGTVVMVPSALVQRNAIAFPRPDDFVPERWRSPTQSSERSMIPFGGGARRCVGEHLAQAEIDSMIPAILDRVDPRPVSPRPERMVVRGTVLVPHRSALTVARLGPRGLPG